MAEGRRCLGCKSELTLETPGELCAACSRNAKYDTTVDTQTMVSPSNPGAGSAIEPAASQWFPGIALMLGGLTLAGYAFGAWVIITQAETAKLFGWEAALRNHGWIVSGVDPSGAAAGKLQNGDRLLAFNEDRRAEQIGPELFMHFLPPRSTYTVAVRRSRPSSDVALTLQLPREPPPGFTRSQVLELIPGLIQLLLGLFMVWVRPNYPVVKLGFAFFLVWSVRVLYLSLIPYSGAGLGVITVLTPTLWWISENWTLALAYHFMFRLFGDGLQERLWRVLLFAVYLSCLFFMVVNAFWATLLFRSAAAAMALVSQNATLLNIRDVVVNQVRHGYEAGTTLLIIASTVVAYRRLQDPDQRRRVRWFVWSTVAALAPFIACLGAFLLSDMWHGTPAGTEQWGARLYIAGLSLTVIPIAVTYAIVKHRMLGIDVVVRQGIKYLLARNVLQVILFLPLLALVLPIVRHPNRPLADSFRQNSVYVNVILVMTAAASLRHRKWLNIAVDRKFFREAYRQEEVLNGLIEKIAEIDTLAGISELVSRQLAATMHPHTISVFYRETARSEMRLLSRSGSGVETRADGRALSDDLRILRMAREARKPFDSAAFDRAGLPAHERDWLASIDAHLLVPIGLTNQPPAGLLVMGEKRSEEPYSPADQKLLQGIAAQMAVVYERVWLKEQVEADRRLRYEVLAHVDPQAVDLLKECPACGACYDNREQTCVHDANLLTHTLPVARTIEARYRLDRRIGQGGMGAVFEATDLRLRRKVAVKVLSGRLFGNLAALRRFEREAEACARLAHRNIVAIHDFGRIGEEGAYLVMEFLAGSTLRSELKRNARIAPPVAAEWFGQLLTGLQTAHEAGVTHRDLKPENILITPNEAGGDRVVILDFGLAKLGLAEPATGDSLTAPGTIVGTVGYMSPEQLSGQPSDQRSDLFSTGVMIFEAMVGKPPFNGDRFVDLLRAISRGCPAIPGDSIDIARLNGVLRKCLAPEPGERFQTAAELRCELLSVLRSVGPTLP